MLSDSHLAALPELTDESLPPISRWTVICGLSLVSVVGVALTLTAIVRYPVKVTAAAIVRPAGEIRFAQAPAEATVKSINVRENQSVRQGDVIATLDSSQLQIRMNQLIGNLQSNQTQLNRLDNQLGALATQRIAEVSLMQRAIASAQADLARTQREHRDLQITTQTEAQEAQADLTLSQKSFDRYQWLAHQGAVSLQQRDEKEQSFQIALTKLRRAQASLNPSNSLITIANERIAQEQAKGSSTLAVLDKDRETLLQQRAELQNQLNRDRQDLKQVEIDVAKYVIRAPETGTLLKLELRNVGQVVRPAESIAQIAPGNAPLVIKAQVDNQDIGKIALEQKVHLRVNAYPYPDYGVLTGEVVAIAPDATQSPTTNSAESNSKNQVPSSYYEVTIQPETLHLRNKPENEIQPGMQVTAEIIAREESVLTFFLRKVRLVTDL